VNFVVRPWVKVEDYWGVYFDLTEKIKKAFDANNVSIPFPQRDVHVYQHGGRGKKVLDKHNLTCIYIAGF
jgi:small conductance mechanosensitive channel